ncbi:DUF887-domain-containing protein [Nadsonia fulvescens var. elongata DSM 6958]|uniref:DUF887-domain-containing protein n=1 Tax=Nadsonia fulvescens var. elongata DSM 6958 TaxID=857566 RepID=A0A1E3PQK5_9ASCO|nr:DUF887-domain-containing protein [Nadsonia fulvescens var. elongata DSM 6958]
MYADPLASLYCSSLADWIRPYTEPYGFKAIPIHFHEILFSFAFYHLMFLSLPFITPLFVKSYKSMSLRTKVNTDIHIVSQLQAVLILVLSWPLFTDEALNNDIIRGYTPYSGFVSAMACGYFIWDSYVCLRYINLFGPSFLLHGFSSLFVFVQTLRPYLLHYVPIFLLFELSTPFVNNHWFFGHIPNNVPEIFKIINGICLLVTFFSARIVWGFYQVYQITFQIFTNQALEGFPLWLPITMLVANFALDCLNVIWFTKMIKLVHNKVTGGQKSEKKLN